MSTASLSAKRGHTTRFHEAVAIGDPPLPADLTDKDVRVTLTSPTANVTATVGFTDITQGSYFWDVTAANLTALGEPDSFSAFLTIFNADNSVFMDDALTLNVTW